MVFGRFCWLSHSVLTVSAVLGCSVEVGAEDWPQWLGTTRKPIWNETGIVDRFPESGPPLVWRQELGGGYSGPAVAAGRVFVMDRRTDVTDLQSGDLLPEGEAPRNLNFVRRLLPGTERVVCLDEQSGKVLWTHEYDCPYTTVATYAIGPRCTPTVDGDRVYALGAEGNLICLDAGSGRVIWSKDFKQAYKLQVPYWGVAAHPLVYQDLLICMVGGPGSTCVAFNKFDGREVWKALSAKEPGYCPPMVHRIDGEEHLIVWDSDAVSGLNPTNGEVYWSVPFEPTFAMSIGAPQLQGRNLFLMSFSRKSGLIQIGPARRSAELVWTGTTRSGVGGVLNTAILLDGHIYACGSNGRYFCVELESGKRLWSSFEPSTGRRPAAWGNVFSIRQGDRFFHANDLGDLIIARMSPAGYTEVSRAHLIDPTHAVAGRTLVWSHPAFANRRIYLRNDREIRCYSLAK